MEGTWGEIVLGALGVAAAAAAVWQRIRKGELGVKKDEAKQSQTEQKWIASAHRELSDRVREECQRLIQGIREEHIRCEEDRAVQRERINELEQRVRVLEAGQ